MFASYRNQSVDFRANQQTGFYMMGRLVVKEVRKNQPTETEEKALLEDLKAAINPPKISRLHMQRIEVFHS